MGGPPPPGAEDGGFAGADCIVLVPTCTMCAPLHEANVAVVRMRGQDDHVSAAHQHMQCFDKCYSQRTRNHSAAYIPCAGFGGMPGGGGGGGGGYSFDQEAAQKIFEQLFGGGLGGGLGGMGGGMGGGGPRVRTFRGSSGGGGLGGLGAHSKLDMSIMQVESPLNIWTVPPACAQQLLRRGGDGGGGLGGLGVYCPTLMWEDAPVDCLWRCRGRVLGECCAIGGGGDGGRGGSDLPQGNAR